MSNENLLVRLTVDKEYSERQVLQSIKTLRGILDRIETAVETNTAKAYDGLQGNEWRLYTELANLERLTEFIGTVEKMN